MNGYVKVKFDNYGKEYLYMIPDYIDISDIQNYVVVENAFSKDKDIDLYCVARVVGVYDKDYCESAKATKFIASTINGKMYKQSLKNMMKKNEIDSFLRSELYKNGCTKLSKMSYEEKFKILLDFNSQRFEQILSMYQKYKEIGD